MQQNATIGSLPVFPAQGYLNSFPGTVSNQLSQNRGSGSIGIQMEVDVLGTYVIFH